MFHFRTKHKYTLVSVYFKVLNGDSESPLLHMHDKEPFYVIFKPVTEPTYVRRLLPHIRKVSKKISGNDDRVGKIHDKDIYTYQQVKNPMETQIKTTFTISGNHNIQNILDNVEKLIKGGKVNASFTAPGIEHFHGFKNSKQTGMGLKTFLQKALSADTLMSQFKPVVQALAST